MLPSEYPPVWREDNVTQDFFGTIVSDPYRWLEDTDSNATLACAFSTANHCSRLEILPHSPLLH